MRSLRLRLPRPRLPFRGRRGEGSDAEALRRSSVGELLQAAPPDAASRRAVRMGGDRRARGRHAHAGIPRDESERPRAPARDRTRPAPPGVQPDAVLAGGGYALAAGRPSRSLTPLADTVLLAVNFRNAQHVNIGSCVST